MRMLTGCVLMAVASVAAADITGKVVSITDGDTLVVLTASNEQVKVRLNEIDAPEKSQAFGTQSRQALSDLCFGKPAVLTHTSRDRYGRTLANVSCNGTDANTEMVKQGFAWVYDQYVKDRSLYQYQDAAKARKAGLWADASPTPPWEFRHGGKSGAVATTQAPTFTAENGSGFTCGTKRTCKQMSSCAEAKFYLTQCGMSKLDRDHDGIPCESLCK